MSLKERIASNPEIYGIIAALTFFSPLIVAGIYYTLDARHDAKGSAEAVKHELHEDLGTVYKTVAGTELRALKREKRKLEGYERRAPNSEYSMARQDEIAALSDEIDELERQLK